MHRAGNTQHMQHTITAITNVVASHTGLRLPTKPGALAACLLLDDAVFEGSDRSIARACAEHVLANVGRHLAQVPPPPPPPPPSTGPRRDTAARLAARASLPQGGGAPPAAPPPPPPSIRTRVVTDLRSVEVDDLAAALCQLP